MYTLAPHSSLRKYDLEHSVRWTPPRMATLAREMSEKVTGRFSGSTSISGGTEAGILVSSAAVVAVVVVVAALPSSSEALVVEASSVADERARREAKKKRRVEELRTQADAPPILTALAAAKRAVADASMALRRVALFD